jgi:hypothetical protein
MIKEGAKRITAALLDYRGDLHLPRREVDAAAREADRDRVARARDPPPEKSSKSVCGDVAQLLL